MEPPTNNLNDDRSSSSDIEIEGPAEQMPQQSPQEPAITLSRFLEVGEYIDCFTGQRWMSAIVHQINENKVCIGPAHDAMKQDWVKFDFLTMRKQWVFGMPFRESQRIEVKNRIQGWMEAIIVDAKNPNFIRIHYTGYKPIYDENIQLPTTLVAPLGFYTNSHGIGNLLRYEPQQANKFVTRYHQYLQEWSSYTLQTLYFRLEQGFPSTLLEKGLVIKPMEGDGNCLFRAISDQLYGTENYHRELRMFAMQYILAEREFFSNFVVGGDVDRYVENKSQDSVWGDNIELQAFRELYNIPIEVYVYNNVPIKTGLEMNPNNQEQLNREYCRPIRISYHGRCHYNSLKPQGNLHRALLDSQFCGNIETIRLNQIRDKGNLQQFRQSKDGLLEKPNLFEEVYQESKRMFEAEISKKYTLITDWIRESQVIKQTELLSEDEQLLDFVMKESQKEENQQFQQQAIEVQILEDVIAESKKQQLQEQDALMDKVMEESELEKAIRESAQTHEKQLYDDPLMNPVIAQVMSMGAFQLESVLEAYTVVGNDPELMINYIYENLSW